MYSASLLSCFGPHPAFLSHLISTVLRAYLLTRISREGKGKKGGKKGEDEPRGSRPEDFERPSSRSPTPTRSTIAGLQIKEYV